MDFTSKVQNINGHFYVEVPVDKNLEGKTVSVTVNSAPLQEIYKEIYDGLSENHREKLVKFRTMRLRLMQDMSTEHISFERPNRG